MYKHLFFILYCFLCINGVMSQENRDSLIVAKIEVTQTENMLTFRPTVQNEGDYHYQLNYLLLVKKKDEKQNLSINQQRGKFTLGPHEIKSLSITRINQDNNQNITAILFVRNELENRLITKDSVQLQASETLTVKEASLHIMSGIVVDESKTKIGRDFYDLFYSSYNQYPQKFDFVIQISELPYRGLSSILQIKVDQDIISEFFANPDEDYLKEQVYQTFRRLTAYASQRGNIKNEFAY